MPAHVINTDIGIKMYKRIWHYEVEKMERDMWLFEPDMAEKNVTFEKKQIEKTPERIEKIISIAKDIFQFQVQVPDEKYIFLGQGTENGMQNSKTYQRLIRQFRDIAGDDNFILKPHPRGEHDDFHVELNIYKDSCPFG